MYLPPLTDRQAPCSLPELRIINSLFFQQKIKCVHGAHQRTEPLNGMQYLRGKIHRILGSARGWSKLLRKNIFKLIDLRYPSRIINHRAYYATEVVT